MRERERDTLLAQSGGEAKMTKTRGCTWDWVGLSAMVCLREQYRQLEKCESQNIVVRREIEGKGRAKQWNGTMVDEGVGRWDDV